MGGDFDGRMARETEEIICRLKAATQRPSYAELEAENARLEKRAKAANQRADGAEARVRLARVRAEGAEADRANLRDKVFRLRIALHDAIRRPLGVTPDSALEFYDPRMADEAEARRPRLSDTPSPFRPRPAPVPTAEGEG